MADGSGWQAVTTTEDEEDVSLEASSDILEMRSNTGGFPFNNDRQDWTVTLGRDVAYNLSLSLNAAEGSMDLSDGQLGTLDVHPNAGSLHMDLSGTAVDELRRAAQRGSAHAGDRWCDAAGRSDRGQRRQRRPLHRSRGGPADHRSMPT